MALVTFKLPSHAAMSCSCELVMQMNVLVSSVLPVSPVIVDDCTSIQPRLVRTLVLTEIHHLQYEASVLVLVFRSKGDPLVLEAL